MDRGDANRGAPDLEARGRVEERHQKTSMASASTRARMRGRIFHGAVEISTARPRTSARSCSASPYGFDFKTAFDEDGQPATIDRELVKRNMRLNEKRQRQLI
jgi:hypothetical protein